jgi:flavodoxin
MSSDDLIVLYGSQTGNAEEIARSIAADLEELDIDVGIMSMQSWIEANNVIYIVDILEILILC